MGRTIEKFHFIFLVAGIGFFVFAFVVSGVVTVNAVSDLPYTSIDEVTKDVSPYFVALSTQYPEQFEKYYPGGPTSENYKEALLLARDTYIGEACWHCHSQQVRPVSNEDVRFGPVSTAAEQQNALMKSQPMVSAQLARIWLVKDRATALMTGMLPTSTIRGQRHQLR